MPHVPDPTQDQDRKREDRKLHPEDEKKKKRERTMDKTLADSYPASDPPSSIPDPEEDDEAA